MSIMYMFQGSKGTGRAMRATMSRAGLPARHAGEWEYTRFVDVSPGGGTFIGADIDAVLQGVAKDGYYLWPEASG